MPLPLLIVVTGPPGSGKTTLARALAAELHLPLLSKDDIKEPLFDSLGSSDRDWSRRLGVATYDVLFALAGRLLDTGTDCMLESNFARIEPFRSLPPAQTFQLYCSAPSELALRRYSTRNRHPGHLDATVVEEVREGLDRGTWSPLELGGETITIDTTKPVDVVGLAQAIRVAG